jgi:hypothetical protein
MIGWVENNNLPSRLPKGNIISIDRLKPDDKVIPLGELGDDIIDSAIEWVGGALTWVMGKAGSVVGVTAKSLATFIFEVSSHVVKVLPQPLRFLAENFGWILLGLLIIGFVLFLNQMGLI